MLIQAWCATTDNARAAVATTNREARGARATRFRAWLFVQVEPADVESTTAWLRGRFGYLEHIVVDDLDQVLTSSPLSLAQGGASATSTRVLA